MVTAALTWATLPENKGEFKGIIIDSLTFLMDLYESTHIAFIDKKSSDGMAAWSNYGQFFKTMLQRLVPAIDAPVIFTAHVLPILNAATEEFTVRVPIKGALKNVGVESFFSTVVAAKRVKVSILEPYMQKQMDLGNCILNITDEEREDTYKYVFQTRPTKDTFKEKMRTPDTLFTRPYTYMDNDTQLLIDMLDNFHKQNKNK